MFYCYYIRVCPRIQCWNACVRKMFEGGLKN
nr:MAG TPA: hypothetical protein [Caudoviricetes sp.]